MFSGATSGNSNRDNSGLNNLTTNGNWWSSTVNNATNAYNLKFDGGTVYPENTNNKDNGFSVRCVALMT